MYPIRLRPLHKLCTQYIKTPVFSQQLYWYGTLLQLARTMRRVARTAGANRAAQLARTMRRVARTAGANRAAVQTSVPFQ